MLMIVTSFVATSCDKEPNIGEIPGCKDIICTAGDKPTFSFSIENDWKLSSDATWCKFITYSGEQLEMSGGAGSHTITLKITDEGIKNQPTFANITIKVGDKEGIIAKVERGADKLYLKLYDVTDTPKTAIKLGYIDWIPFRLEGNFRFAATEIPEWIEIGHKQDSGTIEPNNSITGVPGEQIEAYARIVNDGERERYEIKADDGYVIKFADESGNNTFEFPIIYDGMGNDNLSFTGPTEQYYGWEVSLDGTKYRQTNSQNGQMFEYPNSLEFNIAALNDQYKVILFEKKIERGIPSYEVYKEEGYSEKEWWVDIVRGKKSEDEDPGTLTVKVQATETTRHGILMVMPMGTYGQKHSDLLGNIFEMDGSSGVELLTIKQEYVPFILMEFTQRDFKELEAGEGMYIYHSLTTLEIPATKISDATLAEDYGTDQIYTCPFVNPIEGKRPGIIIDPRITNWTTEYYEAGNASAEVWYNGEKLKMSEDEYYIGENKDEVLALHLWGPTENFTENVYVVFKYGSDTKKLLVVTPPTE